jgi:internalin A
VARLEELRDLNLSETPITDAGLKELSRLQQLRRLNLSGCAKVTDAGVKALTAHTGLQVLWLPGCEKVTDAALKDLSGLKELQEVEIGNCKLVTDAGLKELTRLPKLTRLDITRTAVTDAGLKEMLTSRLDLEFLALSGTHVSNRITPLLAAHKKLRVLSLYQCGGISDESVPHLAACKSLGLLVTAESGITQQGVSELRRALPRCRVGLPR